MLHAAKVSAIADIAIRIQKLGVIEQIEELRAELDALVLADQGHFLQRKIKVVDAGSAADGARRSSQGAQSRRGK